MASDAELLGKARSGDGASLDELLARHERQIARSFCVQARRRASGEFCRQIPGGEVPKPVRAAIRAALLASPPR